MKASRRLTCRSRALMAGDLLALSERRWHCEFYENAKLACGFSWFLKACGMFLRRRRCHTLVCHQYMVCISQFFSRLRLDRKEFQKLQCPMAITNFSGRLFSQRPNSLTRRWQASLGS